MLPLSVLLSASAALLSPTQPVSRSRHAVFARMKFGSEPGASLTTGSTAEDVKLVSEELQKLHRQLSWVRCLQQKKLPDASKKIGARGAQPSFSRLFTHETWDYYSGEPTFKRWLRALKLWQQSSVFKAVVPLVLLASSWSLVVGIVLSRFGAPRISALPLSLQGTAIGLLLVFRTNGSYDRLDEARELWGRCASLAAPSGAGCYRVVDFWQFARRLAARSSCAARS
jgi:hypothetical protein|eukprot:1411925-Prymnesium_polylepis.1